jgi:putative hydrolase of the HAD superfamily
VVGSSEQRFCYTFGSSPFQADAKGAWLVIRAVLFDLDGTLFDRDTSVRTLIARQYDRFADALGHVPKETFITRFMHLDARGYAPKDVVYQHLIAEYHLHDCVLQDLYDHFYATYHDCCTPFPGLNELLNQLRAYDLKLGIITNGGHIFQMRTIEALNIGRFFGAILTSEQEQLKKPDARLFHRAVQRLGVLASEAVFVGDHPIVDIAGARTAGLKAIWRRDLFWEPPPDADGVIDHLPELESQLTSLT